VDGNLFEDALQSAVSPHPSPSSHKPKVMFYPAECKTTYDTIKSKTLREHS